jgi:peroxiredoxin
VYRNLNSHSADDVKIDLGQVLGRKPVLLYYWIAGNPRAEKMFQELHRIVGEFPAGSVALYGVAVQQPGREAAAIHSRLEAIGVDVPVIDDEGFAVGRRLQVTSVPSLAIVDREGRLRLANGASLTQSLEYKIDLATAVRRVAASGTLRDYGYLGRYYPVKELEGQPCPEFQAPLLGGEDEVKWSSLLDNQKVNVLIFWSVDCAHCRKHLPEINAWLLEHPGAVNVVSAAAISNDTARAKTREFCKEQNLRFPVLVDRDAQIGALFHVTTTPTILFIGPNGIIDTAVTSTQTDFGATVEEKKRKLLGGAAAAS